MKRKFLGRAAFPLLAVCMGLAACSKGTTTTTTSGPATAIALLRLTPAGALDPAFAAGKGVALTEFEAGFNDYALATALQSTGEILVAGSAGRTLPSGTQQAQLALLRYNLDGSLDLSFGTNGGVTTAIGSDNAEAVGVIQQADSRIVVAGSILSPDFTGKGIAIVRYSSLGALDTTFGTTGIVTVPAIGTGTDTNAAALALQPADQKIIVAGHANVNGKVNVVVLRYNADGTPDAAFGTNGIVTTELAAGDAAALALALQPDGKILVAGSVAGGAAPLDTLLLRYNDDGTLDKTGFGGGSGFVITDAGGSDFANAVMVQPDNKIVLAGHAFVDQSPGVDTSDFAVIRYDASGALDLTFGPPTGIVVTDLGAFDNALSAVLQSDGKIVVAGNTGSAGGGTRVAVVRYAGDGSLDSTFGSSGDGIVTFAPFGPSVVSSGNAVVLQGGAIVIAGYD